MILILVLTPKILSLTLEFQVANAPWKSRPCGQLYKTGYVKCNMSFKKHYRRKCYIWVTEGHVTYELRKDMLHMSYGRTCYKWVMEGHVTYELNIEVWLIVDVTCPSVTFMYRYGRTNDDSLTNKAFISIDKLNWIEH